MGHPFFVPDFFEKNRPFCPDVWFLRYVAQNYALFFSAMGKLLYSSGSENLHFPLQTIWIGFRHKEDKENVSRPWSVVRCRGLVFVIVLQLTTDPPQAEQLTRG
jgi:hypothetical protein